MNKYFKELVDYTDYHFSFEEKYMQDFSFSDYENHKQKHSDFLSRIKAYKQEYDKGKVEVAYNLMGYLRKWVRAHISEDDIMYAEIFKKNGLS